MWCGGSAVQRRGHQRRDRPSGLNLSGARASRSRMLPAEALRFLTAAGALARGSPAERYRCPRGRSGHEPLTACCGNDRTGQRKTRPHGDRAKSQGGETLIRQSRPPTRTAAAAGGDSRIRMPSRAVLVQQKNYSVLKRQTTSLSQRLLMRQRIVCNHYAEI